MKQFKIRSNLIIRIIVLVVLLCITTYFTEQSKQDSKVQAGVKIEELLVTLPYSNDEVIIDDVIKDGKEEIQIKDKLSGKLKEKIDFYQNKVDENKSTYVIRIYKYEGPFEIVLETVVNLYSNGSFRQIDEIIDTFIYVSSASNAVLNSSTARASSATGTFPTLDINISGSGVIDGTASRKNGKEFSRKKLEKLGFSVGKNQNGEWYFSKYVVMNYRYSLY